MRPVARVGWMLALATLSSVCSRRQASNAGYVRGTVNLTADKVTLDNQELPNAARTTGVEEALKRYQGLAVGVEVFGDKSAVVSPFEQQWQQFLASVEPPPGSASATLSPRWQFPPETPRTTFPDAARLLALGRAAQSVTRGYQVLPHVSPLEKDFELHRLAMSMNALVNAASAAADVAQAPQQQQLIALGTQAYQQVAPGGSLYAYEGGLTRNPSFYRAVGNEAGATVAIRHMNEVKGTGFLISREWILTNRHVVRSVADPVKSLKLDFDYERDDQGRFAAKTECRVDAVRPADNLSPLDIAGLRFKCGDGFPKTWEGRIVTFGNRDPDLNEPLYVIGHPAPGLKQVADNVFLRYPFRISAAEHEVLRGAMAPGSQALDWFNRFYTQCQAGVWCYYSSYSRWGSTGDAAVLATMGFDSNTYPGNSGSPVFFASDHTVAGVFFGGARDYQIRAPYGFDRHEAAIPSTVILEWLKGQGITVP